VSGRRPESGFTLVELLLALGLAALVMALSLPLAHAQKRLWERQEEGREARRALVGALAWVTRDLEQAGYHEAGPPLRQIEPESLSYVLSRDEHDPAAFAPENRRLVTVWLDGEDLKHRIQAPQPPPATGWERGSTQVLASGLAGMRCRALDAEGAPSPDAAAAALVECALTGAGGRTERALVRLRTAGRRLAP
jgi:prepilin-type N-terminal cleavage/methylation domain-containing protein